MTTELDPIKAFVPEAMLSWLETDSGEHALSADLEAVVLFCDISGFTTMANELVALGSRGLEELSSTVNSAFNAWIRAVHGRDGTVAMFIGDALVAMWRVDGVGEYDAAIDAATRAANAISSASQRSVTADVKCGIGVGPAQISVLEIATDRREVVLQGEALRSATAACDDGRGGPVRVYDHRSATVVAASQPIRPPDPKWMAEFVQPAIRDRLFAGQFDWLGELRWISVMMIGFPESAEREALQRAISTVTPLIPALEGHLFAVHVDDKGAFVVVAFGAPVAFDDPANRAVAASLMAHEALEQAGITHSIGVATGRALCGPVGNRDRRTYSVHGDVVNIASRLMSQRDGVIIDAATAHAASAYFVLEDRQRLVLKGIGEPVEAGRPVARASRPVPTASELVGRPAERAEIDSLIREGGTRTLVIEGEAGIGKSALAAYAASIAHPLARVIVGKASALGGQEPYGVWIDAIRSGFEPGEFSAAVSELAEEAPEARPRTALLNALSSEIPSDETATSELSGSVRAENIRTMFKSVFARIVGDEPTLLILEDGHWFDSASWALISVIREIPSVRLLLTLRPMRDPPFELASVISRPGTHHVELSDLPVDAIEALIKARLNVTHVSPAVIERVAEGGTANPLFAEQLVFGLLESGHLEITSSHALIGLPGFAEATAVTNTVESLLSSRIDSAPPPAQLTLKVASVIGRDFGSTMLEGVHPLPDRADVPVELVDLSERRLIREVVPHPDRSYEFWHALIHDVAYQMIPPDIRRTLHNDVAGWFELNERGVPPGVLAHHYSQAENWPSAASYLLEAAESAQANYSSAETAKYYRALIDMGEKNQLQSQNQELARWLRLEADALIGLSDYQRARASYEAALTLLGDPFPKTWARALLGAVLHFPSVIRVSQGASDRAIDEVAAETARNLQLMSQIAYFNQNLPEMLYCSLRAVRMAEKSGDPRSLARAHGTWSVVASVARLSRMTKRSNIRSLTEAERDGSQETIGYANLLQAVSYFASGEWEYAELGAEAAAAAYQSIGATSDADIAFSVWATTRLLRGDAEGALDLYARVGPDPSDQMVLWKTTATVLGAVLTGSDVQDEWIETLLRLGSAENLETGDAIYALGVLALGTKGESEILQLVLGRMRGLLRGLPASNGFGAFGLFGVVASIRCFADDDWVESPATARLVRRAIVHLRIAGFQYPAVRPLVHLAIACASRSEGRTRRHIHRAERTAHQLGTAYVDPLLDFVAVGASNRQMEE